MAKGFTVKAAAPTPKTEDWDYDAIKERMKGKSIVFLSSWKRMFFYLSQSICTTLF
jgi:hypothetical protein